MEKTITITFTPEGNLELPPEIREQFVNGEKYAVSFTEDGILFKKAPKIDWQELRKRREAVNDPNPLTTEEICEVVREVRRGNIQLN
ncbi:MAG: hypothetical protein ACKPEO_08185 [Sphaerospermopsis kisseleviana]|uniref:hypothetical protein n=1 Tax=Sphaerospermopsis sp. LEGE 00249 TaxID=1380707 RepID=UPI00164E4E16|nr:hypothetical protein [Sphaerospermopsis sp. LEGE 00249]MBC5794561.1 hypothetical protein [Sphaerospermopsis sp. LEGE 00249]